MGTVLSCMSRVPRKEAPNLNLTRNFEPPQMFDRWGQFNPGNPVATQGALSLKMSIRSTVSHAPWRSARATIGAHNSTRCEYDGWVVCTQRLTFASHVCPLQLKLGATASCLSRMSLVSPHLFSSTRGVSVVLPGPLMHILSRAQLLSRYRLTAEPISQRWPINSVFNWYLPAYLVRGRLRPLSMQHDIRNHPAFFVEAYLST